MLKKKEKNMSNDNKQGWIKLHRQICENELWFSERFTKAQAWIDLLLLANHAPATIFIRGIEIHLDRGQLAYSQLTLASRWKWNDRTVNELLKLLEKRQMIQTKTNNVTTVITIRNYNEYQNYTEQSTDQTTEQSTSRIQTNKNDKNVRAAVGKLKELLKDKIKIEGETVYRLKGSAWVKINNPLAYLEKIVSTDPTQLSTPAKDMTNDELLAHLAGKKPGIDPINGDVFEEALNRGIYHE